MIPSTYTCCKWWRGLSPFSTSSRDHTVNGESGNFVVHHFTAFVNPECLREKKHFWVYIIVVINNFLLNIHSFESLSTASMIPSTYTCCKWWTVFSPFSTSSRYFALNSERGNFVVIQIVKEKPLQFLKRHVEVQIKSTTTCWILYIKTTM